jgi:glycosidase
MQWNNEKNAGFTDGQPWFPVNPNYKEINVADQQEDAWLTICKACVFFVIPLHRRTSIVSVFHFIFIQ